MPLREFKENDPEDNDDERSVSLPDTEATKGDVVLVTRDAAYALAYRIQAALDPVKVPGKPRTLQNMSPEEVAAIEARYGTKVEPRDPAEIRRQRRLKRIAKLAAKRERGRSTMLGDIRRVLVEEAQENSASAPTPKKSEQNT